MFPRYRRLGLALIAALFVAGAVAGMWHAWDTGRIGRNPRAPTTENFLRAAKVHALIQSREHGYQLRSACLSVRPGESKSSFEGLRDLTNTASPGLTSYSMTLKVGDEHEREGREQSIVRLNAMTRLGLFEARDTTLANTAGNEHPAREYALTADGWKLTGGECFPIAKAEVLGIVGANATASSPDGIVTYEVRYTVGSRKLYDWTQQSELADHVERISKANGVKEYSVKLLRGKYGWIPESLTRIEATGDVPVLNKSLDELFPPLNEATVRKAISGTTVKACLILPSKADEDAVELESGQLGIMSATYFDGSANQPETAKHKAWRRRLTGLARSGIFHATDIPADTSRNRTGGIRYTLADEYAKYIDITRPGCLLLGDATIETILDVDQFMPVSKAPSAKPHKLTAWFRGLARISPDSWSRGLDLSSAPEARAYLTQGISVGGLLDLVDGEWRYQGDRSLGARPAILPWKPFEATPYELMPKATGGTELHLISVHDSESGIVDVEVKRKVGPVVLVLSSRVAVGWRISVAKGAAVSHVVLMGDEKGMAFGKTAFQVTYAPLVLPTDPNRIPLAQAGGIWGLHDIEKLFGRRQDSWQMARRGRQFYIADYTQNGVIFSVEKKLNSPQTDESGEIAVDKSEGGIQATWGSAVVLPPGAWRVGEDPATGQPTISRLPAGSRAPAPVSGGQAPAPAAVGH